MEIDRRRAGALAAALAAMLGGACGRTELWPAEEPTGGNDGGTDVPVTAGDAATDGGGDSGRGDAGRSLDPCRAAGTPCGAGQRCVPALFRRAIGVPGGSDLVLALGDLNHDGLPDLVTLSASRYNVAVWLNDATSGFHSVGSYGVTGQPISAAIGDFTGDGVADIAVAAFSAGDVTTLIGAGDGTFRMGSFSGANMLPRAVVATDLDDDGRLDLVVANQDPNRTDDITLLNGVGGGTFVPAGRYGTFNSAWALAIGDFNGDKKPDVVGSGGGTPLTAAVFYHGAFASPFSQRVASGVRSIAVGDFDGDGIDDIALSGSGAVALLFGTPDNVLRVGPVLSTGAAVNGTASTVVAGDFDADGHVDLAFADGTQLYLFLNSGTGGFQPARAMLAVGNDTQPSQLAAGDLDGDGVTDLLVGSVQGQIIELLSNAGALLSPGPTVSLDDSPMSVASGDFDGDGNIDLAVSRLKSQNDVVILFGDGAGNFPASTTSPLGAMSAVSTNQAPLIAADLDGDGRSEVIALDNPRYSVSVRLGRLGRAAGSVQEFPITGGLARALTILDANEDGRLDLAVPGLDISDTVALLLGNGDGTFGAATAVPGGGGTDIAAADFDGDGHVDLAISRGATVRVLFGDGHGHFSPPITVPGNGPIGVLAGDTDGDGRSDVVALGTPGAIQSVRVQNGRMLAAGNPVPTGDATSLFAAAGDLDGDGRLDVAYDSGSSIVMGLALGNGDGTFRLLRQFPEPGNCAGINVTDLNKDGRLDVVAITSGPQSQAPWRVATYLGSKPYECR